MKKQGRLQIGVMGSAADLNYAKEVEQAAERLGELIAQNNGIVFFGAEKDSDSLSTAACRGAKKINGLTVGVTYGKGKDIWEKEFADVIISSGLERGGGRELVLVLSCDVIIAISGGSGTLTELAIAYQADIPMVALTGYGGWSDKLANTYFDGRQRRKVIAARSPDEAVKFAFEEGKKYRAKFA
ncbi:hypothetical protein KA078_04065 [Candidatus Woesebacteria bacterium]|nr:hypothetical protein [Candidatus Woesebacteria bacterium]